MAIRTRRAALEAALFVLCSLSRAYPDPGFDLDPVTVTAARLSESSSESPPAVSIVTREDMDARGASTLAEALAQVPGLAVASGGPVGAQAKVSIRGSTSNQVLVLVDGQRVNDALTGLVDLSLIPLDSVDRVEVMRGGGSSLYGGDAVGGVINVITKNRASPLALSFENGSYLPSAHVLGFSLGKVEEGARATSLVDSQRASVSWGGGLGDSILHFSGSATRAANAYTYLDQNGEDRELQNASFMGVDLSCGAVMRLGEGSLSAEASGSYGRDGVPGSESSPTPEAAQTDSSASLVAAYSAERFLSNLVSLDASARLDYAGIDYVDAANPSNDGRDRLFTAATEATERAYLADWLTLVYGGSLSYALASSEVVGSPRRLSTGAFAEGVLALGRLSIRPSLRYDYYSDFSANDPLGPLGGALGASYRLDEGSVLKLSLSRAYRVPTFEDLYWPGQDGAEGNPFLRPESSYEGDLGYERRSGSLEYVASAYLRYSKGVILWQPGGDGIWRPSNYGAALYPGIEQEIRARLGHGYALSASYTFLYSYALSGGLGLADDKRLPMVPVHELKGSLSFDSGALTWSASATYRGLRYLETANVAYLSGYFTLDVFLKRAFSPALSAYMAGDNIFDEQYQVIEGYPMPGTRIRLGLELKF